MNILAVDDNRFALESLTRELAEARPQANVRGFSLPRAALESVSSMTEPLDVAFLDIEMPGMSGVALAVKIKERFPQAIIIFVTAYPQYREEAFKVHANGYLMKPVAREMLDRELNEITQPFISTPRGRVRAQTFGSFELYVDDRPLKFARTKSKELVAYLIDRRGAACTMNELAAVLFEEDGEERAQQSHVRHLISDLRATLSAAGAPDIIIKGRNSIAVNVKAIDCDYYRLLEGEPTAMNRFLGEYMSSYSWAEFTVGALVELTKDRHK